MSRGEFDLIQRFFAARPGARSDVALGIGDDCALLQVPPGQQLAVSMDTLVSGVHFFPAVDPRALGHKALAVNLSDLAAMGARPAWATLSLTLPEADDAWLHGFSEGFLSLAQVHGVQLVGGDTCHGPLSITVQVHGLVEAGRALLRSGAGAGDAIYVSGDLGAAALALEWLQKEPDAELQPPLRQRLERPLPRVVEALAVADCCSSAIDLSDGLLQDLGHVCQASGVGADLQLAQLPMHPLVAAQVSHRQQWHLPLAGGDDYELCVTVPHRKEDAFLSAVRGLSTLFTCIGRISDMPGIRCHLPDGSLVQTLPGGYDHFRHDSIA